MPVRIALVGAGAIGRRHALAISRDKAQMELAAIVDPAPAAMQLARDLGTAHHVRLETMLDREQVDGVVIATPNDSHAPIALACIERRIPILIEKPVSNDVASACAIERAATQAGVRALVGHHRRHNPLLRAARDFIAAGHLGRLTAVVAYSLRRKPDAYFQLAWRREPGGGPLLINGIHEIDSIRFLCGEIDSVQAEFSSAARGFAVEDTVAMTLTFRNGAIGTLTLSDAVQASWCWELTSREEPEFPCENADVFLICGTELSLGVPTLEHWRHAGKGGRGDPMVRGRLPFVPADPWQAELLHFAAVIRNEAEPVCSIADGTRTLAVIEAARRAARDGCRVAVDSVY